MVLQAGRKKQVPAGFKNHEVVVRQSIVNMSNAMDVIAASKIIIFIMLRSVVQVHPCRIIPELNYYLDCIISDSISARLCLKPSNLVNSMNGYVTLIFSSSANFS